MFRRMSGWNKAMRTALPAAVLPAVMGAILSAQTLDLGHEVLRERGLTVAALVYSSRGEHPFDDELWGESGFKAVNWGQARSAITLTEGYGIDWILQGNVVDELTPSPEIPAGTDGPYAYRLAYEVSHEPHIDDPAVLTDLAAAYAGVRAVYPGVPLFTKLRGGPGAMQFYDDADIVNYVNTVGPDILVNGDYLFFNGNPPAPHHPNHFPGLEQIRSVALAAGLPYGTYLQAFSGQDNLREPSVSDLRFDRFTSLAYGYKFLDTFIYDGWISAPTLIPALFSDAVGTDNPTALFYELAQINREVGVLASSLVYLLSTDVRYVTTSDLPDRTTAWQAGASDAYITSIQVINQASPGDLLVGYFTPMLESDDGPAYSNQVYFMVVNCRHDYDQDAGAAVQEVQIDFDFADAPSVDGVAVEGLQRLNRTTGRVERLMAGRSEDGLSFVQTGTDAYRLTVTLPGGTGDLFKFDTGAFFVNGMTCADAPGALTADITGDCSVNLADFGALAGHWLLCNDPEDPLCTIDCSDPANAAWCR